ncbi:MAG: hypothetical protein IKX36_12395 [Prevotella sp.]|nr:hypothetical protein [Prevotella sp.]
MKKVVLVFVFAVSAAVMFNSCKNITEDELAEKVKKEMVNYEKGEGKNLEVISFDLGQKVDEKYNGVLKGRLNGQEVVYDVVVIDEGSDYDVDWDIRKEEIEDSLKTEVQDALKGNVEFVN